MSLQAARAVSAIDITVSMKIVININNTHNYIH